MSNDDLKKQTRKIALKIRNAAKGYEYLDSTVTKADEEICKVSAFIKKCTDSEDIHRQAQELELQAESAVFTLANLAFEILQNKGNVQNAQTIENTTDTEPDGYTE